jgi:hypothetical protein
MPVKVPVAPVMVLVKLSVAVVQPETLPFGIGFAQLVQ